MNSKPIPKGSTAPRTKIPKWVAAIPKGYHGSGELQKRLWTATSDFVRIRDWYKYGTSIVTGKRFEHWRDGRAGHFISYSVCNGMFKFNPSNIHLQDSNSNNLSTREDWNRYESNLIARYGPCIIDFLETENRIAPIKFSTSDIIKEIENRLDAIAYLDEKPDYYERVQMLRGL